MLSFTSIKVITSWIISALTHPECVYTAEFHLSVGTFDLKITLGFEISKSTVRSRQIHISLPEEVGVGLLSCLAGGILLSNTQHTHEQFSPNSVCPADCFYSTMYHKSILLQSQDVLLAASLTMCVFVCGGFF